MASGKNADIICGLFHSRFFEKLYGGQMQNASHSPQPLTNFLAQFADKFAIEREQQQ